MVQFYPWFKFSFLLFQTNYHVIIIHYHTQKQKKRKFEPRIKLNHNIYMHAGKMSQRAENMKPSVKLKILEEIVKGYHECFFMASAGQKLIVKKKRGHKDPALMVTDTGPAAASLDFAT